MGSAVVGTVAGETPGGAVGGGLRLERVGYGHPDALRLVAQVQAEYTVLYGSPDESPMEPAEFEPPAGSFFVGYAPGGEAVATGAWRARPDVVEPRIGRAAEIKRMYVAPTHRGRGYSRAVLAHLESDAVTAGFDGLVLETGLMQPAAIALYRSAGYAEVGAYGHYRDSEQSVYLGRSLGGRRAAG
ncbi:GNAT family N-acetyltransferase [Nocardioides zeae]|uniref:GNAT family N-acetyltransferase n=1 Tax=Nocardioides imazamoxiresistens TaxID=3231893 RepID=A0ABU3PS32_9ACTN|nr:GNAT family N-acetyltransferase [Nocardioides zeae]MDT9592003.1 GNAT family N-acetyltransferase [Nocardioides zeae]